MRFKNEYTPINSVDIDVERDGDNGRYRKDDAKVTLKYGAIFFVVMGIALFALAHSLGGENSVNSMLEATTQDSKQQTKNPLFDSEGRYVMYDFDVKKVMANFLPGLGGFWGTPMWCFYVNRGQGVASFGIQNKDGAIAKYNSAEKVYQQVPFTGFRTFVRGRRGETEWGHMPFYPGKNTLGNRSRKMMIGMNSMEISELDTGIGLETNVTYLPVTNQNFPGLVSSAIYI